MKLSKAAEELKKKDLILARIITRDLEPILPRGSVYESLLRAIISQQISVSAANSIREKFLKAFGDKFPEPKKLLKTTDEKLRFAGLSKQKISYMKNVAEHFISEKLDESKFHNMSDREVIDDLVKIKGVGEWTAEMILIFTLHRHDIFSYKDLGLVSPIYQLYKINPKKYKPKNLKAKVLKITEKWSPHRSLACRYLWLYWENRGKNKAVDSGW
jgi:DNA-3-methyladenine glycosylase II